MATPRQVKVIDGFTFAGTKYVRGDVFPHALPDVELRGLVRAQLVAIVSEPAPMEAVAPSPVAPPAPKPKRQRTARPE